MNPITKFIEHHYRHFNAAALVDAARAYKSHVENGNRMLVAMAGAMSTAELGISLAEMIRQDKVHAISCTGANLEEDLFNLVAHDHYRRIPDYRYLATADEVELLGKHLNRVTDTCIPEEEAIRRIEQVILEEWTEAHQSNTSLFPHEFLYRVIRSGKLKSSSQIPEQDSWLVAACEKNLPLFVPGWEDSTLGNICAARCIEGKIAPQILRHGIEYMIELARWYESNVKENISVGFFQIGGGIAGDFPICVV
ncbi:MAG: deoxyhypusine synthase family protein, partial [Pyrinomonadaceae bacterium]